MYSQQSSLASKCFASYFWQNERPTNQQLANPKFNFTVVEGCTSGGHSETFCHGTSYDSWTGPSCEDDCEFTSRSLLEPRSASWRSWQVIGNEGLPIFSNKIKGIYKPLCLQQQKWHLWLNLSFFFWAHEKCCFFDRSDKLVTAVYQFECCISVPAAEKSPLARGNCAHLWWLLLMVSSVQFDSRWTVAGTDRYSFKIWGWLK